MLVDMRSKNWVKPDLSIVFLLAFTATTIFLYISWGDALLADTVFGVDRTELGHVIHSIGGALLKTAIAFLFWILLDKLFQPWLNIRELFYDDSPELPKSVTVRSAFIYGYYILAAAVILAVSLGGTP